MVFAVRITAEPRVVVDGAAEASSEAPLGTPQHGRAVPVVVQPRETTAHIPRTLASLAIVLFARAVTAVRGVFSGSAPNGTQRVYFANHASHGDFVLVWAVLPPRTRARTRPVAASEYWLASRLRRTQARPQRSDAASLMPS